MSLWKRATAEHFGIFRLVLGGCLEVLRLMRPLRSWASGSMAWQLAFGLSVLTMANAIGHISESRSTLEKVAG